MSTYRIEQLEECHREMFGDLVLTCPTPTSATTSTNQRKIVQPVSYPVEYRRTCSADSMVQNTSILENEKRRASALVDELLIDIYYNVHNTTTDYNSATSGKSHKNSRAEAINLQEKDVAELRSIVECFKTHVERMGSVLVRRLKRRDALRRQQEAYCDVITRQLAKRDPSEGPTAMRFTIQPAPGDSGFQQWAAAMKMVAQLPGGIPPEFRRRLWLTLAERHLAARGVDWQQVERTCFSEWSHPADAELGVQIVKDLHRTGCSLFCGEDGQENQALLKRVLLAYARWNKAVGYCQGFNMLAALILQVTDKCESDALKLMIYLIEGVLPDSYFADSLRGLSVDMAVFRELLRSKLPRLSRHLDTLQSAAKDGNRSYEPPLTNVFTMQWFLTLFCNCLPQPTVLRVWDLILLEGNEILLRTALAIWQVLAERILGVRSADEFYCIMGVLTRELLEFDLVDGNSLIKAMVTIGPLTELKSLREHYLYNINPWGPSLPQAVVEKQLKLYSRQSIALDISALKKQYAKLKQRQRQAHIIFSAAISRQPPPAAPVTMNHLLLGKSALVPAKRLGPPKGSIPPARQLPPSTLLWKDAPKQSSSSSSSDTELCDDDDDDASGEDIDDNPVLPPDSDSSNILMSTDDNTISAKAKTSASETDRVVEVDAGRATSPAPTEIKSDTCESDDESFDFERFLEDRVRHLKVDDATTEDEPEVRINYTRRNSSKALQIIQENSLILHRILQCQARMTPSPSPPTVTDESKPISDLPSPEISTGTYPDFLTQLLLDSSTATELKSPEYGSRYTSILEKSKSLDEKYNALILNTPPLKQSMSEQKSITSICEEKLQTSQASSYFVDSVLYEGKVYEAASPEKCSIASSFTKKYRLSPEENESNNLPELEDASSSETYNLVGKLETSPTSTTIEYTFPTTDYGNYSYKFPSDSSKEEQTGDTLTSFRWNDTPEQAVSPYSNNDDTDSGVISILESNSSEYPKTETVTNDSKSTPVENGHGATTTLYDYSFPTLTLEEDSSHSSYYKDLVSRLSNYPLSSEEDEVTTNSKETSPLQNLTLASPSEPDSSRKKSLTLSTSPHGESSRSRSPSKSPSKVFNPFPVPLSSRQSKEVPLKLGLYKK